MFGKRKPKRTKVVLEHPPETPTERRAREDAVRDLAKEREQERVNPPRRKSNE